MVASQFDFVGVFPDILDHLRCCKRAEKVTVDGKRLDEHYDVKRFTEDGFEWAYEGASPQQLALAILYDYLGDKERSMQFSEPFMKTVIVNLDNEWTLDNDEIDSFLRANAA